MIDSFDTLGLPLTFRFGSIAAKTGAMISHWSLVKSILQFRFQETKLKAREIHYPHGFGLLSTFEIRSTSRFREFKADYPIEVGGMNEHEFRKLVQATSETLDIVDIVENDLYLDELFNESDGHPYVVKVLLGEVAKDGKLGKVKRIVAGKDEILTALFERTFNGLTPVARRIFLTLSNWRSTIPEIAIEAILMRESNEHMDVEKGVEELHRSSLIIVDVSERDGMRFLSVPYSASVFGKKKLAVSPMKTAIQADTKLLLTFGVGINSEIHLGIEPRIIKFFRDIAKRVSLKRDRLENYVPILEFICRKYPHAWMTLAALYEEEARIEDAIKALQSYLEITQKETEAYNCWDKLAVLYSKVSDWNGEVHALIELGELSVTSIDKIRTIVFKVNFLFKSNKYQTDSTEKKLLTQRLITVYKEALDTNGYDADDCSMLAWLYLNASEKRQAILTVKHGLQIDPTNTHCVNLKRSLFPSG